MKKLLSILILLTTIAKAQTFDTLRNSTISIQNGITITGATIIIPHQTISGGGSSSSGTIPVTTVLPLNTFTQILQPTDYLHVYTNTTKNRYYFGALHSGDNGNPSDNRTDQPLLLAGYNTNFNNGRAATTDGAWDWTVEDHYYIFIGGIYIPHFEDHILRVTDYAGHQHRTISAYVSKIDGTSFINMETNNLSLFQTLPGGFTHQHISLANAQIDLNPNTGGGAAIRLWTPDGSKMMLLNMTGTPIFDLPNTGFGGFFHTDGYGHTRIGVGTYTDDNDAKTNGHLVSGDDYWTIVNGRKTYVQVQ
jgi:hypothetical protein